MEPTNDVAENIAGEPYTIPIVKAVPKANPPKHRPEEINYADGIKSLGSANPEMFYTDSKSKPVPGTGGLLCKKHRGETRRPDFQ